MQASDLAATRQAIEQHQEILYSQEAHEILDGLTKQAHAEGNSQTAEMFANHLAVLQACEQDGIAATFARLEEPDDEPETAFAHPLDDLPVDFSARCIAGLKGSPQDRQALFGYLGEAVRQVSTLEAEKLVKNIQLLIFGQNPASLGEDLREPYVSIWQAILAGIK